MTVTSKQLYKIILPVIFYADGFRLVPIILARLLTVYTSMLVEEVKIRVRPDLVFPTKCLKRHFIRLCLQNVKPLKWCFFPLILEPKTFSNNVRDKLHRQHRGEN